MQNKWPPVRGHFLPQSYNLNNSSRGPLDGVTYINIKDLGLLLSDKKIFLSFQLAPMT